MFILEPNVNPSAPYLFLINRPDTLYTEILKQRGGKVGLFELLDETRDPSVIAKAMREAGDFLINYKPKGDE